LSRPPASVNVVDIRPADRHLLLMVENAGCPRYPNGLTVPEYEKLLQRTPDAKRWAWRAMVRDARVYVRGQIRHSDHKTVGVHVWHRVFMNTESRAMAMRNVAFLD